jgi:hypothetical protein
MAVVAMGTMNDPCEEQVFAFDVPLNLSADDAAKVVDDLCPEGFYPWQTVMWPEAGMRVFCKRAKASKPGELAEARLKAKDAADAQADLALAEMVAATPCVKPGVARVRLARLGHRRGYDWVAEALERAKATYAKER